MSLQRFIFVDKVRLIFEMVKQTYLEEGSPRYPHALAPHLAALRRVLAASNYGWLMRCAPAAGEPSGRLCRRVITHSYWLRDL